MRRLRALALATLGVNVGVIVLGALVRATGSGAGCGSSWPSCNGTLVPALEGATAIEFTHRAASGIALLMVAALVALVLSRTDRGHPARRGAVVTGVAIVVEALIGAVIVLAEWVADDASVARAVSVPIHLVSTYVLLAALVLTIFWLSGGGRLRFRERRALARPWWLVSIGMIAIAATGAVTALADTLFPKESFAVGALFDPATSEHFLTELRVFHPIVAIAVGLAAAAWAATRAGAASGRARWAARAAVALVGLEVALGIANVVLLTPTWLSLLHLAVADGLWVVWVWLGAELFGGRRPPTPATGC